MKNILLHGLHPDIPEEVYHADPAPQPSLSNSVAKVLLNQSPWHAWHQHPRLSPAYVPSEPSSHMRMGSLVHRCLAGDTAALEIVEADTWAQKCKARDKKASLVRKDLEAEGKIAVLPHEKATAVAMYSALQDQLSMHGSQCAGAFMGGLHEVTGIAHAQGIWMRARADWLNPDGPPVIYDYKTTGASAHPDAVIRTIFNMGYDVQAAFYASLFGGLLGWHDPTFRFVFQETDPPYAVSVVELAPSALEAGRQKVDLAIQLWSQCIRSDTWPLWPPRIATVEAPIWAEKQWVEHRDREQAGDGVLRIAQDMQAPMMQEAGR